jgi:chromate reductase, NAD(P)H dehydrogenase (quinone)
MPGALKNAIDWGSRFDTNLVNFMDQVEASTHYPCIKRAWVEYLGEHPEPALDRVE